MRRLGGVAVVFVLVTVPWTVLGAGLPAGANWGTPVSTALPSADEIVQVAPDASGVPHVVRGVLPPSVRGFDESAKVALNARGDLVALVADSRRPSLVYTPAGGAAQIVRPPQTKAASADVFSQEGARVAVDPAGNAVAVWFDEDGKIVIASHGAGDADWSPPTVITTQGVGGKSIALGGQEEPAIAMNSAGQATVMWVEIVLANPTRTDPFSLNNLTFRLQAVTRVAPGTPWSAPVSVSTIDGPIRSPRVGMDGTGNAVALWRHSPKEGGGDAILSATRTGPAGSWIPDAEPLLPAGEDMFFEPQLAVSNDGHAVTYFVAGTSEPRAAVRLGNAPWSSGVATGWPDAGEATLAVTDGGIAILAGTRRSFDGSLPADFLGAMPVATVAGPDGVFTPLTDLDVLSERNRTLAGAGIGPDGRAVAAWTLAPRAGQLRMRVAEYAPGLAPPTPRPPVTAAGLQATTQVLASGTLAWLHLTLSAPAERLPLTVLERGRPVARWTVTGRRVAIPVRISGPGRHAYRIHLDGAAGTGVSPPVRIRAQRATRRTVPISPGCLVDYAAAGNRLWVLTGSYGAGDTQLRAYDARTARPLGGAVSVPGARVIAAGARFAWVLTRTHAIPVSGTTLKAGAPIAVFGSLGAQSWNIAADDGDRAWVFGDSARGFLEQFVGVDAGLGRVVRRMPAPIEAPSAFLGAMTVAVDVLWVSDGTLRDPADRARSLRIDLRNGRMTMQRGTVMAGYGQSWRFTEAAVQRISPRNPSAAAPRNGIAAREWGSISVGSDGAWVESADSAPSPVRDGSGSNQVTLQRFDPATSRISRPVTVSLPEQRTPDGVFGQLESHPFEAGPGGVWVALEGDGVLMRIPSSETR